MVCEHCDSVYKRGTSGLGEEGRCAVCDAVLYRGGPPHLDRWLALAIAAAICFVIANTSPVLRLSLEQLHNDTTLWQAALALAAGPGGPIAAPLALFIIIVPGVQIGLLCWVLWYAYRGRRAPGFTEIMRLLVALRPWGMVEVGLLGILVTAIKLSSYMQVVPGYGLWAMGASLILYTLLAQRDVRSLWDATEPAPLPAAREAA